MSKLNFPQQLSPAQFLADYWQKKPLLMPQALPDHHFPLTAEELAGLACEPEIESRMVLERGTTPWEARLGPFSEETFSQLPESHWTFLIQDLDKQVPETATLLDYFRFIPNWRLDDLMVSYAADQGSVGPHIDDYDVFLIQITGKRRWKIHTHPVSEDDYIPGLALRILPEFEPEQEWVMEPGDVLYLPPNVAHWGLGEGDGCITCSVGFRAPTLRDMAAAWCEDLIQQIPEGKRYRDESLTLQDHFGEITPQTLGKINKLMQQTMAEASTSHSNWFGRFITEPKIHLEIPNREDALSTVAFKKAVQQNGMLQCNSFSHFAFSRENDSMASLYVNGQEYPAPVNNKMQLPQLTESATLNLGQLNPYLDDPAWLELLTTLYNHSHYHLPGEEDD